MGPEAWSLTQLNVGLWALSIPLGLLWANALEWLLHRYVLHGLGRSKKNFWSFHWWDHHNQCRRRRFRDPGYQQPLWVWSSKSKELLGLQGLNLIHLPLLFYAPALFLTLLYSNLNYYRVHKRAHLDPEWAKRHVPWHYDHHMGRNQDLNWGVTRDWWDRLLGTREPWLGTEEELASREAGEES